MYKNFWDLLRQNAEAYGEKAAFIIKHKQGKEVKYEEKSYIKMYDDARAFAAALVNKGLAGKRIAIIGKNCYSWIISLVGAGVVGCICVPMDKGLSKTEILEQLSRIEADAIVFGSEYEETAKESVCSVHISMEELLGYESVEDMLKSGYESGIYSGEGSNAEETGFYLFTSGTTSKSKIVTLTQRNILANIEDMRKCEDIRSTDVNLALLPFHHTFGMTGILMYLACGATNVFCEGLRIQKAMNEYHITSLVGVPLILDNIRRAIERKIKKDNLTFGFKLIGIISSGAKAIGIDIRRKMYKKVLDQLGGELRLVISGAAPLAPETGKFFEKMGVLIIQGYGLTETAPVLAAETPKYRRAGSIGKPMPSVELKVVNPGPDGVGELVAKGPNVMTGYYQSPELTAQAMEGGYFHTGDLAYIDKDGYIFITGRIKNVIVLENGKNVYPEELEFHIGKLDYVKEVLVVNEKDGKKDKVTAIVVVDPEEISVEEAETRFSEDVKAINKRLANYKQIMDYRVTDQEFVKTTSGKIKRNMV